jgi:NAD(P)-dependent dehydrogenase (short-subunit alcohol dehydrogenase family)
VATFIADLSLQASVRRLAVDVLARYPKLDVLVNNAGAMYGTRQLTKEGIELTWAVNHLAPFLLSKLLLQRLKESAPARTQAHQGAHIRFDDLSAQRSYRGFGRYSETKLANILFTASHICHARCFRFLASYCTRRAGKVACNRSGMVGSESDNAITAE